jgi:transcriptional regulator with XRE-family HTH domain
MLRARKGWTQVDLGDALGVSQSRISDLERDKYGESHHLAALNRIAVVLDAELIVRFKVRCDGNTVQAETLG